MNKDFIVRDYNLSFAALEDEPGVIEGKPVVYNSLTNLGYFDEIIETGALDEADLRDVRLCLNHDTSYVYARSRRNSPKSTMRLSVGNDGLEIWAKLDVENSPKAQDFYSAIKRGDIDKMSFMFSVDDEEWEDLKSDHPTRHIRKIGSIVEVSAVTFPAYNTTEIFARSKAALDSARAAMEIESRQNADALDSAKKAHDLEIAKLKTITLTGGKK